MKKTELTKRNEEVFDMNIIEMPEQLDELSMSSVKGGAMDPPTKCCAENKGCNIN